MKTDPASLDRLHDIVPPPAAPWWPPAPAWYWVLGLLALLLLVFLLRSLMCWRRNKYRREALAEFARHESSLLDPARRAGVLAALAELLKRTALTAFPREQVASLTGDPWFQFLDRTGRQAAFARGGGKVLEAAAYNPGSAAGVGDTQARELASHVRDWLAHHRVDRGVDAGGAA